VRNDDGHDYDSTSFGDLQMQVGFQVSDGRFMVFRNCSGSGDFQDFSSSNEFTYTFKAEDITNCTVIFVGVRNNDGLDADGTMFGDLQYQVPLDINF
jgi:hypothetical protein